MKFAIKDLIFLDIKEGISQKSQKGYCIITLLMPENNVIRCFTENKVEEKLNKFDRVDVAFRLIIGKNNYRLNIIDIRKSA